MTRHFTYFQSEELQQMLQQAGFRVLNNYHFNGQQRGVNSRDIEWVVLFAKKEV